MLIKYLISLIKKSIYFSLFILIKYTYINNSSRFLHITPIAKALFDLFDAPKSNPFWLDKKGLFDGELLLLLLILDVPKIGELDEKKLSFFIKGLFEFKLLELKEPILLPYF